MARVRRDISLEVTKEEREDFVIPEGWYSSYDQWPTRSKTVDLFKSEEYGCAGCTKKDECEIRKAVCTAMGENYPIFPKDWLAITPEGLDAWSPRPRILCNARLPRELVEETLARPRPGEVEEKP